GVEHDHVEPAGEFVPVRDQTDEPLDVPLAQQVPVTRPRSDAVDRGHPLRDGGAVGGPLPVVLLADPAVADAGGGPAVVAWHGASGGWGRPAHTSSNFAVKWRRTGGASLIRRPRI